MSMVRSWFVHDSPCPLGTQRQRQPLPVEIFEQTDYPHGPPPGEGEMHLPFPEAVLSLSGSPVPRPLAPPLTASRRGPGRAGRTSPLLKAAADAVRERGWMQGAALGDEQAGRCNQRTSGGSSCPPRQEVLDRLSLLLCSRELQGHVTGCVAEEASLGYRNLEATRHSQSWCSWTTSVDIARPRDRAITFVARGARSGAVRSSFRTSGS